MPPQAFVWLVTGCSSGIGRELAMAVLKRGDKVIATTRAQSFDSIRNLTGEGAHILELDVTASLDELKAKAAEAVEIYGKIDVVTNNAGFLISGSLEETTHEDMLAQFNTNVFGALNVSRVFLPYMRERKTGTIAFIGSGFGWLSVPFAGLYVTSKFAIRGLSETLHEEIAPFGLRSICFDSGCFRTSILDKRREWTPALDAYKKAGEETDTLVISFKGTQKGDPVKGVNVIIDIIKGEGSAAGKHTPVGLALGADCYEIIKTHCESTLARLEEWREVTLSTDYSD